MTPREIAQEVADQLMADLRAGKFEKIDVDDVARALWARADRPADSEDLEKLLELTLRSLVERC